MSDQQLDAANDPRDQRLAAWASSRPDVRAVRRVGGGVAIHYTDGRVAVASRGPDDAAWIDVRTAGHATLRRGPLAPTTAFGELSAGAASAAVEPGVIQAPTAGTLASLLVSVGDLVAPGQALGIIELMKMEIELQADVAGTVIECVLAPGAPVERGAVLIRIG